MLMSAPSLYARLLGPAFERLPPALKSIHDARYGFDVSAHVRGVGLIVHYKGWLVEQVPNKMDRELTDP